MTWKCPEDLRRIVQMILGQDSEEEGELESARQAYVYVTHLFALYATKGAFSKKAVH